MTNGSKGGRRVGWIVAIAVVVAFALAAFVVQRGLTALGTAKQTPLADMAPLGQYPLVVCLRSITASALWMNCRRNKQAYRKDLPRLDVGQQLRYDCWKKAPSGDARTQLSAPASTVVFARAVAGIGGGDDESDGGMSVADHRITNKEEGSSFNISRRGDSRLTLTYRS
jgi:hypothetical protein